MRHMLKALGFWIWGLIAISIAVSVVPLGYRVATLWRLHDVSAPSDPSAPSGTVPTQSPSNTDLQPTAKVSRLIASEMTAAQQALQAGNWIETLRQLTAAEARSPLTAFDRKTIADFKGFAYVRLNNLRAAQDTYETALATGAYTPEETQKTNQMVLRLAAGNQDYATAVAYGEHLAAAGSATAGDLTVLAQVTYLQKDCKNSGIWADKAISAARKAGEQPQENLFQFKLQCASDAGDNGAMAAVLVDLIKLTNKTNYWNTLLRIERQDERDDHNLLMIYRVMYDTDSMNTGSDYMEMAQLLGDAALQGEAAAVLDKAVSSGKFTEQKDKDRAARLANSLKPRAETDKKGEAAFDAEAAKNPAGELDVKSGEIYYGSGDYQSAATVISRGIQKGQIKHLDEAYVFLGRSQVALKNDAEAARAFAHLKTVAGISDRVLRLWTLYAETLASPAAAIANAS
jgi:tetratricopeptide (TPR) repeat protein